MFQNNGGSLPALSQAEIMGGAKIDMANPTLASMPDTSTDQGAGLMPDINMDTMQMDLDFSRFDPTSQLQPNQPFSVPFGTQPQSQPQTSSDGNVASDGYTLGQDNTMTGAGAGPLPTGFGVPNANASGSTLTEFTKRRNWSQRVLEELRDLLHILTPDGRILYVSPSCKYLTGFETQELVGRFVTDFIHPDDRGIFVKEFNESIASGNPLRFFYRFQKHDESWAIFESHGHPHLTNDMNYGAPGSIACRGFFMMARPYPTKNAALLDSFLEHKIENERLTKRIAELKREEQLEQEEADRQWKTEGQSSVAASESFRGDSDAKSSAPYNGMPPPAKPEISNTALTRENLVEALAASKPDSINDKMARYEGATHLETIEMLTGLRYRDGERSQGISTGDTSPLLIRGDVGIQISQAGRDGRTTADKKKKVKLADEYVCTDCGTLDSPEWRKGPSGPKTLCNACGLRWAKKEKKKQNASGHFQPAGLQNQTSTNSS